MSPYLTTWLVDGQKATSLNAPAMVSSSFSWEKVYTLDFGIDFGFFNNRLNGTFDWYRRDTKGMLAPGHGSSMGSGRYCRQTECR